MSDTSISDYTLTVGERLVEARDIDGTLIAVAAPMSDDSWLIHPHVAAELVGIDPKTLNLLAPDKASARVAVEFIARLYASN